jgi:hypothetical protein
MAIIDSTSLPEPDKIEPIPIELVMTRGAKLRVSVNYSLERILLDVRMPAEPWRHAILLDGEGAIDLALRLIGACNRLR